MGFHLSPPRLNISTVSNIGATICLDQGGLCSLRAFSLQICFVRRSSSLFRIDAGLKEVKIGAGLIDVKIRAGLIEVKICAGLIEVKIGAGLIEVKIGAGLIEVKIAF